MQPVAISMFLYDSILRPLEAHVISCLQKIVKMDLKSAILDKGLHMILPKWKLLVNLTNLLFGNCHGKVLVGVFVENRAY